jgi:hypothetical protein
MEHTRNTRWIVLFVLLALTVGCGTGQSTPTATPVVPTDTPEPTPIPPTKTPMPTNTPMPTPTKGPIIIDDDFSVDSGRFQCDGCSVQDGALIVGAFPMVDTYAPYMVLCKDCGDAKNYKMSVDTWYIEGNSNAGFGLVLRNVERQYAILMGVSSWQLYNVLYFDKTVDGGRGWFTYLGNWTKGGLKAGRGVNHIDILVESAAGKSVVTLTINDDYNRSVDLPSGSGKVGVFVGRWEIGAAFDNFHYEEIR